MTDALAVRGVRPQADPIAAAYGVMIAVTVVR
jgi:hypothetical protein